MQKLLERLPCNAVMLQENLMMELPAGAGLLPVLLVPTPDDVWAGDDARDIRLKTGKCLPSAVFYEKLARNIGAKVTVITEGVVETIPGQQQYRVQCRATMLTPSGEVLEVEAGKSQPLLTSHGQVQAHIVESTTRKAKRNAVKALLALPTVASEADFMRPWMVFRPVFDAATAGDKVKAILAQRDAEASKAITALYGPEVAPLPVASEATLTSFRQRLNAATTAADVNALAREIARTTLSDTQRADMRREFKDRLHLLTTGEAIGTQVPTEGQAPSQQTVTVAPASAAGEQGELKL